MPPTILVHSTVNLDGQSFISPLSLSPASFPPALLCSALLQLPPLITQMMSPGQNARQICTMAVMVGLDTMVEVQPRAVITLAIVSVRPVTVVAATMGAMVSVVAMVVTPV